MKVVGRSHSSNVCFERCKLSRALAQVQCANETVPNSDFLTWTAFEKQPSLYLIAIASPRALAFRVEWRAPNRDVVPYVMLTARGFHLISRWSFQLRFVACVPF